MQPGSWLGDSVEEFKNLPPWGKFAAAGAVVAVAGIGFYEYKKNKSAASVGTTLAGQGGIATDTTGGGSSAGLQSPFASVGSQSSNGGSSVPLLPSGVNPVFDPSGGLIAFQSNTPPPATQSPAPGATVPPPMPKVPPSTYYTNMLGQVPNGSKISPGGIDQNNGYQRFWYNKNSYFLAPVGSSVAPGGQGRLWLNLPGKDPKQQGVLITKAS